MAQSNRRGVIASAKKTALAPHSIPDTRVKLIPVAAIALFGASTALAQTPSLPSAPSQAAAGKIATATRIRGGSVRLDGRLDEAIWQTARPVTDFVQKEPVENAKPTDSLEVRFLFDDASLYVATRVVKRTPRQIQAPISRRDNISQAEHIWISIDSYRDRRTAYSFGVTASGVRGDWYHSVDSETNIDMSFDPVWEAAANQTTEGWTSEMRIPFSQLRFNASDVQTWGLNVDHWVPSTKEDVFWVPVPRNATGWSSRMGTLAGIEGIKPARRLEVTPYIATDATMTGERDRANPFDDGSNLNARMGGDVKVGLGPSLTLQATVNPDFGQVEADPAEVNLSAFETIFSERRPFFVEGNQLLGGAGQFFYSRRIGARPRGPANGDYVDYPSASTILGAAKLTGRLASGTSIGALAAVTAEEKATVFDSASGDFKPVRVAPLVGYGVGRVQKEFGKDASTVALTLTGVRRDVSADDPLAALLTREAYSGATSLTYRIGGGTYEVDANLGFSHVEGDSTVILGLQRSSARYFQRPDAESYVLDPSRRSLSGTNGYIAINKNAGKHWLGGVETGFEGPGLELNDAGRLGTADGITGFAYLRYRETKPGRYFRGYGIQASHENEWNFDRDRQFGAIRTDWNATLKNFWTINFTAWHDFRAQNSRLTRGGPLMQTGASNVGIISIGNSFASKTRWTGRVYYGKDEFGAPTNRISGSLAIRPSTQWELRLEPNYLRFVDPRQYVRSVDGGQESTFGRRYVFARVDRAEFFTNIRVNYTFRPDLSLEVYAQPFAASGAYSRFGQLSAARSRELIEYGSNGISITPGTEGGYVVADPNGIGGTPATFSIPSLDYNIREVRSNVVMRWEYRPGSTLFLVWQQNREGFENEGSLVRVNDLFGGFNRVGTNFFAIKANFWVPVL
jgi:hypothetical protein